MFRLKREISWTASTVTWPLFFWMKSKHSSKTGRVVSHADSPSATKTRSTGKSLDRHQSSQRLRCVGRFASLRAACLAVDTRQKMTAADMKVKSTVCTARKPQRRVQRCSEHTALILHRSGYPHAPHMR